MDIVESAQTQLEKFRELEENNKQILEVAEKKGEELNKILQEKSIFLQATCQKVSKEIAELDETFGVLGSRIEGIMRKVIMLNDLYETIFVEKYKKSLQAKVQKKEEELEEYRLKKKKVLDDLADNFNKMNLKS